MAQESRLQPEVISFDAGIKADAPGDSLDFADMVNLMPPPDGSAGVIPRHKIIRETSTISVPVISEGAGAVFQITPNAGADPDGTAINFHQLIGVVDTNGVPVALMPHYDALLTAIPEEWENSTSEYYKA